MNGPANQPKVTRRQFLRRSAVSAGVLTVAGQAAIAHAKPGGNPFAYDIERFLHVDPELIHYEKVGGFKLPRPEPRRMARTPDNHLCIAAARHIMVFDHQGQRLSEFACPEPPRCVSCSAEGEFFVGFKDRVEIYEATGKRKARWESVPGKPFVAGLAVGPNDVFVADAGNRILLRYDRSGKLLRRIGERDPQRGILGFAIPSPYFDVEIAPDGLLRVTNPGRHRVEAYTFDGELELAWGRPSAAIEGFCGCCNPVNIEVMPDGRILTFEKGLPRVKVYSSHGELESVVAGPTAFADPGKRRLSREGFDRISGGLDGVLDAQGRVCVLDMLAGEVLIFRHKKEATAALEASTANRI